MPLILISGPCIIIMPVFLYTDPLPRYCSLCLVIVPIGLSIGPFLLSDVPLRLSIVSLSLVLCPFTSVVCHLALF